MAGDRGQASVELVAVLPALVVGIVIAAQLAAVGHALWSAADAARAGARAAHVDGRTKQTALDALPKHLRERAEVRTRGRVRVEVRAPGLVPGVPDLPLSAATALDPAPDG